MPEQAMTAERLAEMWKQPGSTWTFECLKEIERRGRRIADLEAELAARPAGEPVPADVMALLEWVALNDSPPSINAEKARELLRKYQPPPPLPQPVYRDDKVTLYRNGDSSACVSEYPSGYGWRFEAMGPRSIVGTITCGSTEWTREYAEQAAAKWVAGVMNGA